MIREPQQRIAKQAPSILRPYGVESPPEIEPSPKAEKVSAEDRQADLYQTNTMISGSASKAPGRRNSSITSTADVESAVKAVMERKKVCPLCKQRHGPQEKCETIKK